MTYLKKLSLLAILFCTPTFSISQEKKVMNVLFIGNSYTARHNLADVVKTMAEEGNPELTFNPTTVIYGGRTLSDHWNLGSQNVVNLASLTADGVTDSLKILKAGFGNEKLNSYVKAATNRQNSLLKEIGKSHPKWDVVVLQSYRDDTGEAPTKYAQFAPKFAKIAKAQGAKVVLYATSPNTQNAEPLTTAPDPLPVKAKAASIAKLGKQIDAAVAPIALAGMRCQTERPDLTLRFINDAHLNHTMAYMTACALYAAIFDKTPVGLNTDSITDIRHYEKEPKNKQKDRDGNPITRTFSESDRADLQRFAWEAYNESKSLR